MANIECVHFVQIYLSFYPHPNTSDRFPSHFIRVQIFQINFSLKNEKILLPNSHCNFPIVHWSMIITWRSLTRKKGFLSRPFSSKIHRSWSSSSAELVASCSNIFSNSIQACSDTGATESTCFRCNTNILPGVRWTNILPIWLSVVLIKFHGNV